MNPLYLKWLLTGLLGGAACGLAGFLLIAMQLPFLGICLAHAALAGAVLAYFLGTPVLGTALAASLLASVLLGPLADRTRTHANTMMSILFSLTLGLAFLGIGLLRNERAEILGLMWGNLLLVRWRDLIPLLLAFLLPLGLLLAGAKETKAILFDRRLAAACGIPASAVYYTWLTACGVVVTVNLQVVGGLMLFSLLTNPAAAALQLTRRFAPAAALSSVLAAASAVLGLVLSFVLDWPAGASIVIVSALVYSVCAVQGAIRRRREPAPSL